MLQYNGIRINVLGNVYEPAEDTFLLLGALEKISLAGKSCLEIGTGSGIVALFLAKRAKKVVASDINPEAVACAKENAALNGVKNIEILQSDLFQNITGILRNCSSKASNVSERKFDIIVFNPPYLPSEQGHKSGKADICWDGGEGGRQIIGRFIRKAPRFLAKNGCIILLESSLSQYRKTMDYFRKPGFSADILARQKLDWEELVVMKIHMQTVGYRS